ncbi:FecR family protein [Luteimonas soli]|uniref:FecR family protein n=1 Tax=Luteimonas soli TaxID=1648966 RepID=A0ABV7XGK6_9GAMM
MEKDIANSIRIERAAAAWLARRDAGGWAGHDQAELDRWLAASTAHRVAWLRLQAAWRESGRLKALGAGLPAGQVPATGRWAASPQSGQAAGAGARQSPARSADDAPASVRHPRALDVGALVFAPRRRETKSKLPALAAAVAIVAVSLALGWRIHSPTVQPVAYGTAVGALETAPLADGSEAILSSDSRIVVALSRRERRIELQRGEAFFHAAKDPKRPFVVAAGGHQAVAVGTRFAVRRDADGMRVVVTEGLVRLESAPGADGSRQPTTLLPAGSVAVASAHGVMVQSGTVEQARQALSWRDGFLAFHDTSLAAAAAEFNRYNTRKIVIADPSVGALRIGGSFRWSNAEAFVRLLEQGFPVRAEYGDAAIVLHDR